MSFQNNLKLYLQKFKTQLFITVPKAHHNHFKEQVYYENIFRFSTQSALLFIMDAVLLIFCLTIQSSQAVSGIYMKVLSFKVLVMALSSLLLQSLGQKSYNPQNILCKWTDMIFLTFHSVLEFSLFYFGPKDLGAIVRLISFPIVACCFAILSRIRSSIFLIIVYILMYISLTITKSVPYTLPHVTNYSFWIVVCFSCILLAFSIYTNYVCGYISNLNTESVSQELAVSNETLKNEVHQRTSLLDAMNTITNALLNAKNEDFCHTMNNCLKHIGIAVNADRAYVWKNHFTDDKRNCSQMYEWSGGAEAQQGNELTTDVPFPEAWYPNLSSNQCVNSLVSDFTGVERDHLRAQSILSIMVVPIFVNNEFWGFLGFDDCHCEHLFSEVEESILRTIGILFANSMLRYDTTQKLIQATQEAVASSKAKSEFLSNMSHELRTPINAITGMSNMAQKAKDKEELNHCLANIDTASKQLLSLINDILDMSKIEAGKMELAEVAFRPRMVIESVTNIIRVQTEEKKQQFTVEIAPDLTSILVGDDMRISQILTNLLSNAVKFTPSGGNICFTANCYQHSQDNMEQLEFIVEDNGIGIDSEQQKKLFSKFEQAEQGIARKFGGTGLGLSITKNLVELMNGTIELHSTPGQGSRFTVHVFLKKGTPDMLPLEAKQPIMRSDFSGVRALLVEDMEINQEIVIAMLEDTGIQMDTALNGVEALEKVSGRLEEYDIIFMDIRMPLKDGYTTTREIRALKEPNAQTIPIIAMTANAFAEDVEKCLDAGMNDHVAKPIDYEILVDKMELYL